MRGVHIHTYQCYMFQFVCYLLFYFFVFVCPTHYIVMSTCICVYIFVCCNVLLYIFYVVLIIDFEISVLARQSNFRTSKDLV